MVSLGIILVPQKRADGLNHYQNIKRAYTAIVWHNSETITNFESKYIARHLYTTDRILFNKRFVPEKMRWFFKNL